MCVVYRDSEVMTTYSEEQNGRSYASMVSFGCIMLLAVLVVVIFSYWCCYYPKVQSERNNRLYLDSIHDEEAAVYGDDENTEFVAKNEME